MILSSLSAISQSRYGGGVSLKEFGIGAGAYFPSMDYYKDRTGYEFNTGLSSQVFAHIALNSIVGIRLSTGYNRVSGTQPVTSEWSEEMSLGLMPFNGELLLNYNTGGGSKKFQSSAFNPIFYIGAGTGYNLLFIKYTTPTGGSQKNTGSTLTYHGLAGIQVPIGQLAFGIEGQYVFGSYSQAYINNNGSEFQELVSINGPKIMLTAAYEFSTGKYGRGGRRKSYSKRYRRRRGGVFRRSRRPRRR